MPRFKTPDYGLKMIPVDFQRHVLPASFEFALCHLVDKELDLSALRSRFRNDAGGAPAFDPAVLFKIVLLAYSRGLVSSRAIEACRRNVLFMAVSGDACPHFTTLVAFDAELGDDVAKLFAQVLVVGDRQGLIGRDLFAIDGVKLSSNASNEKSGTRADFERQAARMEVAVKTIMERQTAADAGYHLEVNLAQLAEQQINAYICDNGYRLRDPRYAGQDKHKAKPDPLRDKRPKAKKTQCFTPADFELAEDRSYCICPAGTGLYNNGKDCSFNGYAAMKFRGAERDCAPCDLRQHCLRKPDATKTRQVAFFQGKRAGQENHTDRMKAKIDSDTGKQVIAARFTRRGRAKVDGQWKLLKLDAQSRKTYASRLCDLKHKGGATSRPRSAGCNGQKERDERIGRRGKEQ